MAFNPTAPIDPMIVIGHKKPSTPVKPEVVGSPPADPLRGFAIPNANPFPQFAFSPQMMAQAMAHAAQAQAVQAQAAQAAQASLGFPVMFPAGIPPQEFKPEMLAMGGGPMPQMFLDNASLYHPYAMDGMKKRNATRETTLPLKKWLREHQKNPYPTKGEKVMLAIHTHMTLTQVSTWFANARRRLKKENKMTWSPQNRRGEDDEDDDDMAMLACDRPSSSNSNSSDRKDFVKHELSSPTPSGGSSEEQTPKKPKIWSIADVASENKESSSKKDSPSSDESSANMLMDASKAHQMIQQQWLNLARLNPQVLAAVRQATVTNPAAQMMFNPMAFLGLGSNPMFPNLNLSGLTASEGSDTSPNSTGDAASPSASPNASPSPAPIRIATPATPVA